MSAEPLCVADFEAYLRRGVEDRTWRYIMAGADGEQTLHDNMAAFRRYRLRPRCLRDVSHRDTSCSVLGHRLAFPVAVSPTAFHHKVHYNGEMETVQGVSGAGTAMVLSMWASKSLEDVRKAAGQHTPLFLQFNFITDKSIMVQMVRRAEDNGYSALFVSIDQPLIGRKFYYSNWSLRVPPGEVYPQLCKPGEIGQRDGANIDMDRSATWADVTWLRSITSLPIVAKGVLTAEAAREAVRHGVAGIVVSNHGGRQLDGVPATIDVLAEVVEAVRGSGVEVYLDGGIRKGTDVLKALALGARAVFIGRPALWGLAYDGARGVTKLLGLLKEELSVAMALSGCASISDITPDLVTKSPCCKL